jgi:hypothetical protein
VPSILQKWAESLNCRRWEGFTTDTNDGQLEQSLPLLYIDRPAAVILCFGPIGGSFTAIRQVLSETEEFVPSRVLLTLFQRDRIFGRDTAVGALNPCDTMTRVAASRIAFRFSSLLGLAMSSCYQ